METCKKEVCGWVLRSFKRVRLIKNVELKLIGLKITADVPQPINRKKCAALNQVNSISRF